MVSIFFFLFIMPHMPKNNPLGATSLSWSIHLCTNTDQRAVNSAQNVTNLLANCRSEQNRSFSGFLPMARISDKHMEARWFSAQTSLAVPGPIRAIKCVWLQNQPVTQGQTQLTPTDLACLGMHCFVFAQVCLPVHACVFMFGCEVWGKVWVYVYIQTKFLRALHMACG